MTIEKRRMRPEARRAAIVEAATFTFGNHGFAGTTTAQLAEACGVTQPILYRHFPGKVEIYLACLEHAWEELRALWDMSLASEPEARNWLPLLTVTGLQAIAGAPGARLWIRSLSELHDDERIRSHVRDQAKVVHEYLAAVIERAQQQGGVAPHVVPRVEAWIFLSTGLLFALSHRLDDLVGEDFFVMLASRYREVAPDGAEMPFPM